MLGAEFVGGEFVRGRVCQGPSLSGAEMSRNRRSRTIFKSVLQKTDFLITQPEHMLWILKRTVSMRRFFLASKTYVKTDG